MELDLKGHKLKQIIFFFYLHANIFWNLNAKAQCLHVDERRISCGSDGDIQIVCPEFHNVYISLAYPKNLREPGCNITEESVGDSCPIEPLTTFIENKVCKQQQICNISHYLWAGLSTYKCRDYKGDNIMQYDYRCIPNDDTLEMTLCSEEEIETSFIKLKGAVSDQRLYSSNCMCRIDIPPNTEISFERVLLDVYPLSWDCSLRIAVANEMGDYVNICKQTNIEQFINCKNETESFYVKLENDSPSKSVLFQVHITASYQRKFRIKCGLLSQTEEQTTLTDIVTVQTTSYIPPQQNGSDYKNVKKSKDETSLIFGVKKEMLFGAIAGIMVFAMCLSACILGAVIIRKKVRQNKSNPTMGKESDSRCSYISDIYEQIDPKAMPSTLEMKKIDRTKPPDIIPRITKDEECRNVNENDVSDNNQIRPPTPEADYLDETQNRATCYSFANLAFNPLFGRDDNLYSF